MKFQKYDFSIQGLAGHGFHFCHHKDMHFYFHDSKSVLKEDYTFGRVNLSVDFLASWWISPFCLFTFHFSAFCFKFLPYWQLKAWWKRLTFNSIRNICYWIKKQKTKILSSFFCQQMTYLMGEMFMVLFYYYSALL